MLSKSFIQFSVDGWICVPSLLFTWGQTMVEVMKIMATSFKRSMQTPLHSVPPTMQQQATANPCLCWRLLDTHSQVWVSFLWGHCSFLLGPGVHKVLFVPSKSLFPVLCKFWWFYGGVNGDLLQEGLCHTQACCTQSPWPCGSPLLTCTSTGDTQTQFWGVSVGSLCPGAHKVCLSLLSISGRYGV